MCFFGSKFTPSLHFTSSIYRLSFFFFFPSNRSCFFCNSNLGGESGVGTGPIRNPETGVAGYEDENGVYHDGADPRDSA